jgi:hypothetical protein
MQKMSYKSVLTKCEFHENRRSENHNEECKWGFFFLLLVWFYNIQQKMILKKYIN